MKYGEKLFRKLLLREKIQLENVFPSTKNVSLLGIEKEIHCFVKGRVFVFHEMGICFS